MACTGSITRLGEMRWGIDISLNKLSGVSIASDGQTATIAGGTNSNVVVDTLWAAGKQTVTGTCECVSYLGPALNGTHGWLQGRHGLIADQFVSIKVVLAGGTLTTGGCQSDLWWAVRGAGHDFGIVASVTVKIYPRVHVVNWAIETLTFAGDKVKALYQAVNCAFGDETPRGWYGHEQWRQDRLKGREQKYDPRNRFGFYALSCYEARLAVTLTMLKRQICSP